jgi:hypothetical protein
VPGLSIGERDIIKFQKEIPRAGLILSRSKLVVISQVTAVAKPEPRATWCAKQEANLVLLLIDKMEVNVGTSRIFVPSGKTLEEESYHTDNFFQTSWSRSVAHSKCRAKMHSD